MTDNAIASMPEEEFDFSGSLNAGSELDDEIPVENSDELILNLEKNNEEIVPTLISLENKANDLEALLNNISYSNGMTKHFAMEAEALLPEFPKLAPTYYSTLPTKTRYKASVESIMEGIKNTFQKLVKAIYDAVVKIINWITGKKSDASSVGSSEAMSEINKTTKEKEKSTHDIKETNVKVKRLEEEASSEISGSSLQVKLGPDSVVDIKSLQDVFDIVYKENTEVKNLSLLAGKNPVLHDMLTGGEYSKSIFSLQRSMDAINSALSLKVDLFNKLLGDYVIATKTGITPAIRVELTKGMNLLKEEIKVRVFNNELSLRGAFEKLTQTNLIIANSEIHSEMSVDAMFKSINSFYSSLDYVVYYSRVKDIGISLVKLEDSLKQLEAVTGSPATDTKDSREYLTAIRQSIYSIGMDISSTKKILMSIDDFYLQAGYFSKELCGAVSVLYVFLEKRATSKTGKPAEWKKYVEQSRILQSQLKESYRVIYEIIK